MKKVVFAGLVASAICSVSAFAADMPVKAPMASAPSFNWSGWYVGGEVGGERLRSNGSFDIPPPVSWRNKNSSGIFGGILGAQFQTGVMVLGVEGSVAALFKDKSDSVNCDPVVLCGPLVGPPFNTMRTKVDPIFTIGGRFGLAAFGQVLPYIAGGYAQAKIKHEFLDTTGALLESTKHSQSGTYIGAGIDWALPARNWILGIEYRHYSFGSRTDVPIDTTGAPVPGDQWTTKTRMDALTARLTYKFDSYGKSPVVAKY